VTVNYRGLAIGGQRIDFIVANTVVLEIKAAIRIDPVFQAKLISYLRKTGLRADS
jgi:GxxExxY protein